MSVPPSGFLTGIAWVQSNGRFDTDQIMGCTFCWIFNDIATIDTVSCLTAIRLQKKIFIDLKDVYKIPKKSTNFLLEEKDWSNILSAKKCYRYHLISNWQKILTESNQCKFSLHA